MRRRTTQSGRVRRTPRGTGRRTAAPALLVVTATIVTASGCSGPVNVGSAAEDEFEAWSRAHPSEDYRVLSAVGTNLGPFSGSFDVVISADGAGDVGPRMWSAAQAICAFEPTEGAGGFGLTFRSDQVTVPLSCQGEVSRERWRSRVGAQAGLVRELAALPDVRSVEWRPTGATGFFELVARPGADADRLQPRVEVIVATHPLAFADPDEVSVLGSEAPPAATPGEEPTG